MRGKTLRSVLVTAFVLISVMFAGIASADVHGKSPPGSSTSTILTVTDFISANSSTGVPTACVISLSCTTGSDDMTFIVGAIENPGATQNLGAGNYACGTVNNGPDKYAATVARSSSEAWRSSRGTGKVYSNLSRMHATRHLDRAPVLDTGDRT